MHSYLLVLLTLGLVPLYINACVVLSPAGSAKPGLQPSILASSTATASAAAPAPATAGTAKADGGWTAVLLPGGAAATAMLHGGHAGQRSLGPLLDLLVVLLEAYEVCAMQI